MAERRTVRKYLLQEGHTRIPVAGSSRLLSIIEVPSEVSPVVFVDQPVDQIPRKHIYVVSIPTGIKFPSEDEEGRVGDFIASVFVHRTGLVWHCFYYHPATENH